MAYAVGPKGQIVIAKEIRERLGVGPGWVAIQSVVDDHLEVYFVPPEHRRSLKGVLADHVKTPSKVLDDWHEIKAMAWRNAARDRVTARKSRR